MFGTSCKEENDFTNKSFAENSDAFVEGMIEGNDGEILSADIVELPVGEAIKSSIEETANDERYMFHSVAFVHDGYMYNIGFMSEKILNGIIRKILRI